MKAGAGRQETAETGRWRSPWAADRLQSVVHLCFGLRDPGGLQNVELELTVQAGASVTIWSHCLFSFARDAKHAMRATINVEEGVSLDFQESHYHRHSGGMKVWARAQVKLAPRARHRSDFSLLHGRVGELEVDHMVNAAQDTVTELLSRVYGSGPDAIRIRESVELDGESARAVVKSRVAVAPAPMTPTMHRRERASAP